ncbi:MAG: hypothetical protein P8Y27_13250 [Chromatiaceae bacterium]
MPATTAPTIMVVASTMPAAAVVSAPMVIGRRGTSAREGQK